MADKLDTELFSSIYKPENILGSAQDLEFYGKDSCKEFQSRASLILLPNTVEQVVETVKICGRHKIALVPSGGRTGYSGGATASQGEVVLSLCKLNKVFGVNTIDRTIRVQAGVTTETVRQTAITAGLYYPVEFASQGSSQIGGNIATNAGGIRVIRYGTTRDWVLGVKVVTASGEVLDLNGALFKNQSGYDLRSLFIGSEGTLGIIVEATLKLTTAPKDSALALCAAPSLDAVLAALSKLRSDFTVNVFEYFERNALDKVVTEHKLAPPFKEDYQIFCLVEVELGHADARTLFEQTLHDLISGSVFENVILSHSEKQSKLLMSYRELISETIGRKHFPHKNDISVPIPSLSKFVPELRSLFRKIAPNIELVVFGHIGDGNLHLNLLKPDGLTPDQFMAQCKALDSEVFALVQKFAGSISAEHGVGLLKKEYLRFSRTPAEISLFKELKKTLDPDNILNPGKIF